ncbi:MAG TPA: hypothetical protein VI731_04470, partial [Bacteroidia bacterium]|nr:hypothetical protein [Bacteroidia bacterium]
SFTAVKIIKNYCRKQPLYSSTGGPGRLIVNTPMSRSSGIKAFADLGSELRLILQGIPLTSAGKKMQEMIPLVTHGNGWFTNENVRHRLEAIVDSLEISILNTWLSKYSIPEKPGNKRVGVIIAGNIPLAGFDDFRCVLLAGHIFIGKLSSGDKLLLPLVAEILTEIQPEYKSQIQFTEERLPSIDAVIATGSNNSARYFDYYFSKYPHIIRKNRNGVAILTGKEDAAELDALGEDIFRYFGLGCRSVTKLFVPAGYNFNLLFENMMRWGESMMANNKYMNNYEYNKTVYLLSKIALLDNNFLLLKEDEGLSSPPGVLFYEYYDSLPELRKKINAASALIQCIVAQPGIAEGAIPFGQAQQTLPSDYADNIDSMQFLLSL